MFNLLISLPSFLGTVFFIQRILPFLFPPPSPDEDTLTVMSLPQAAVTLVGHSEYMRRQLPHLVFAVEVDCSAVVQASYLLVGIYRRQDRTNVGLREMKKQKEEEEKKKREGDKDYQ